MRICYFGTYERSYPRNKVVIDALRTAGAAFIVVDLNPANVRRAAADVGAIVLDDIVVHDCRAV